jgi:hypothetical protein
VIGLLLILATGSVIAIAPGAAGSVGNDGSYVWRSGSPALAVPARRHPFPFVLGLLLVVYWYVKRRRTQVFGPR